MMIIIVNDGESDDDIGDEMNEANLGQAHWTAEGCLDCRKCHFTIFGASPGCPVHTHYVNRPVTLYNQILLLQVMKP